MPGLAGKISDNQLSPTTPRQQDESGAAFEPQTGAKQVAPTREMPAGTSSVPRYHTVPQPLAVAHDQLRLLEHDLDQVSPTAPRQHDESGAAFEPQTGAKKVAPTREMPAGTSSVPAGAAKLAAASLNAGASEVTARRSEPGAVTAAASPFGTLPSSSSASSAHCGNRRRQGRRRTCPACSS